MVPLVTSPSLSSLPSDRRDRAYLILCGAIAAILAGLLIYSQRRAFAWDAGFHLLAARLIREGKRPYLDFCFPQTPLNAYLNAGWMSIFGDTWRSIQALASIMTAGAILLTADFVYVRFPVREWKLPAAIFSALLCASIYIVVAYGTVAQAYGVSLFSSVAGLRLAMDAVRRESLWLIFAAGLCASASAACSLLTAAAVPVILVWCVFEKPGRWKTAVAFLADRLVRFFRSTARCRRPAAGPLQSGPIPDACIANEMGRSIGARFRNLLQRYRNAGGVDADFAGCRGCLVRCAEQRLGSESAVRTVCFDRRGHRNLSWRLQPRIRLLNDTFMLAAPFLAIPATVGFLSQVRNSIELTARGQWSPPPPGSLLSAW